MTCEYCGHPHALDALCQPRLQVSRRTFLFLGLGAGMAARLPGAAPYSTEIHGIYWLSADGPRGWSGQGKAIGLGIPSSQSFAGVRNAFLDRQDHWPTITATA